MTHRRLEENLQRVRERIATAALRAGRRPSEVTLVGVTKYSSPEIARKLFDTGCHDLGESRPQELWNKAAALADLPVRWHLIGHLQRNKIARTLTTGALIHSVDSLRLLAAIDEEALRAATEISVLLEVNVSGEPAKHGFQGDELLAALPMLSELGRARVVGLMAMSGLESSDDQRRHEFDRLRALRDRLRETGPQKLAWNELSMGMSDDLEAAVEAGSTMVRVGSALVEGSA